MVGNDGHVYWYRLESGFIKKSDEAQLKHFCKLYPHWEQDLDEYLAAEFEEMFPDVKQDLHVVEQEVAPVVKQNSQFDVDIVHRYDAWGQADFELQYALANDGSVYWSRAAGELVKQLNDAEMRQFRKLYPQWGQDLDKYLAEEFKSMFPDAKQGLHFNAAVLADSDEELEQPPQMDPYHQGIGAWAEVNENAFESTDDMKINFTRMHSNCYALRAGEDVLESAVNSMNDLYTIHEESEENSEDEEQCRIVSYVSYASDVPASGRKIAVSSTRLARWKPMTTMTPERAAATAGWAGAPRCH